MPIEVSSSRGPKLRDVFFMPIAPRWPAGPLQIVPRRAALPAAVEDGDPDGGVAAHDVVLDVLVAVQAPPAPLAVASAPCLRELLLFVQALAAIEISPPAAADGSRPMPVLAWRGRSAAMLRLRVPPAVIGAAGRTVPLLRVRATGLDSEGQRVQAAPQTLALPVVTAGAWAQMPESPAVRRAHGLED